MEQDGQLSRHGHHGSFLCILAFTLRQLQTPRVADRCRPQRGPECGVRFAPSSFSGIRGFNRVDPSDSKAPLPGSNTPHSQGHPQGHQDWHVGADLCLDWHSMGSGCVPSTQDDATAQISGHQTRWLPAVPCDHRSCGFLILARNQARIAADLPRALNYAYAVGTVPSGHFQNCDAGHNSR